MGRRPPTHAYILRNGKIDAQIEAVKPAMLDMANRSIATLIKAQAMGLYCIYTVRRR
jgi:hypothetical protein